MKTNMNNHNSPADNTPAPDPQTMTSMEIAEVTGKNHFDVLKAIRKMEPAWEKVTASKFTCCLRTSELANGVRKQNPYYVLTKTECLYVATKFNDEARAKLVLRWEQLEKERLQPAVPMPVQPVPLTQQPSRRQILLMALQAEEECQRLREESRWQQANMIYMSMELGRRYQIIQQYAPEALPLVQIPEYAARPQALAPPLTAQPGLTTAGSTYTATQIAQEYGMKAIPFNSLLSQAGIQQCVNGQWVIAPDYAGNGYTATRYVGVTEPGGRHLRKPYTVWTDSGRLFLIQLLRQKGILPLNGQVTATAAK